MTARDVTEQRVKLAHRHVLLRMQASMFALPDSILLDCTAVKVAASLPMRL